jgi:hypothetical protein
MEFMPFARKDHGTIMHRSFNLFSPDPSFELSTVRLMRVLQQVYLMRIIVLTGVLRSSLSNSQVPRKYHIQSQVSQEHHAEPTDSLASFSLPMSLLKIEL